MSQWRLLTLMALLSLPAFAQNDDRYAVPELEPAPQASATMQVHVLGLFTNMAILNIDGQQRRLKQGETSPEGVYLVSADSKGAVVRIAGETRKLLLSRAIGTHYKEADTTEVRLSSSHNGHFFGSAMIQGTRVQFMVDTGASAVVMNSIVAKQIGVDMSRAQAIRVATAQGVTLGHQVSLKKVSVGDIDVRNVSAIVLEGEHPVDVLLGNSFLSQVDMSIDNGVMVLQTKY
jgi:aspartyl protease family protein